MDFFAQTFSPGTIEYFETFIDDWFFVFAVGLLILEYIRYSMQKRMNWELIGDSATSFITLAAFISINFMVGIAYVSVFFVVYENFSFMKLEITPLTIIACILLADFAYYWEHRAMHRIGIGWLTHTVHHSSPHFNISVAYRFGPLDGLYPIFFHLPLAMMGFHPFVIFFAEMLVQLYQTALHTEVVKRLPRPVEFILNTPSHHRVHHGSNPEYLDKNYAGIFIIWDRMFGTFEEERAKVKYGLVTPIDSINPFVVFFHGFPRLANRMASATTLVDSLKYLVMPPDWEAKKKPGTKTKLAG